MPSRIGLGLAALGRPAYITLAHADDLGPDRSVGALERRTHELLDAAYAEGIRYVDVARSYGRAEEFLASWLARRGLGPEDVVVGSKWGYTYTGGWRLDAETHEVKDLSVATLRRQLGESRALLGAHLRLYQIHSATLESGVLDDAAVLDELARVRDSGLAVGFTVTGPRQAETIERALRLQLFDAVQATWNLLERSVEEALAQAKDAGLAVIVKEALANGRLTRRRGEEAQLAVAHDLGVEPDAIALAAALARPWADTVLSGAVTVTQLRSNLAALRVPYDDELDRRLAGLREDPQAYWSERSALAWN